MMKKALGLWTQMQEEDLAATDQFLSTLGDYLQKKGLQVPFIIRVSQTQKTRTAPQPPNIYSLFRQKVKSEDLDTALEHKHETLAIKYAKNGIVAPLNVLWTHYFINGNDEKAEQIWKDYLKDSPRIMFQK
ncbi:hypothetical protein NQ314_009241 [Rhamnusium bicolor]|uniref:Uncharacterized protein n=1 Tax=Rhamnusium bicolor TaxID=1586634 RepID=A0AAV8Y2Z6_9CUCU|nr:hypothetical protein NQ314_009241 [Rhamnusium bicolor]